MIKYWLVAIMTCFLGVGSADAKFCDAKFPSEYEKFRCLLRERQDAMLRVETHSNPVTYESSDA